MLMADETFNFWGNSDGDGFNEDDCGGSGDVSMDLEWFLQLMQEPPDPSQGNQLYQSMNSVPDGGPASSVGNHQNFAFEIGASYMPDADKLNGNAGEYGTLSQNSAKMIEAPKQPLSASPSGISSSVVNQGSRSGGSHESGISQMSGFVTRDGYSTDLNCWSEDDIDADFTADYRLDRSNYQLIPTGGAPLNNIETEADNSQQSDSSFNNQSFSEPQVMGADSSVSENPMIDFFEGKEFGSIIEGNEFVDPLDNIVDDEASSQIFWKRLYESTERKPVKLGDLGITQHISSNGVSFQSFGAKNELLNRKFCLGSDNGNLAENFLPVVSDTKCSGTTATEGEDKFLESTRSHNFPDIVGGAYSNCQSPIVGYESMNLQPSLKCLPSLPTPASCEKLSFVQKGRDITMTPPASVKPGPIVVDLEDEPDISIIEDVDLQRRLTPSLAHGRHHATSPQSTYSASLCGVGLDAHWSTYGSSLHGVGVGLDGTKPKAADEDLIFQAAVQDLSQPKAEAAPPDGVLAITLLRHQRIALSWMVQKETASWQCCGGILADDQGLGKTVSTIALILKERSPSAQMKNKEQGEPETLDLDGSGDSVPESDILKKKKNGEHVMGNGSPMRSGDISQTKGRPAAGTLIVCPTSVLRQWDEELHSKVTKKANLSVLVYHGSTRTKDPFEVAKYDVVLTTYSIVSMEVPKQPLNDKEKEKVESDNDPPLSASRKRKHSVKVGAGGLSKGIDKLLHEATARPLARVNWFRVVLDEAQSIKNYRTRVAQACWGLRAKRRWCLSGTPIQNAVDDLYSYFRFLRYDPYSVFKSFCSMVKVPISKNPAKGYKKLQAVLKTIMLRRTKGTLLDGEPIIILPPKSIKLMKVEFSKEERDFYSQLEAESRAQFMVYQDSGTVQEHYVSILLMLLRLRQACDHPLLVEGYDSSSISNSSLDMASKLTRERQLCLLNFLEGFLAICGICSDPPEDAVVSMCGHVFCNQCIFEHLTGDDGQCPTTNCKVQLSVCSVFSRATLKRCLLDEASLVCSGSSDCSEVVEPALGSRLLDSSKIKAVLKVLQSLSKPRNCMLENGSAESVGSEGSCSDSSDTAPGDATHIPNNRSSGQTCLNNSVSVVREKAIVFSQWTRMLDLLEACLKEFSIQYRRLDGTMSVVARDKAVRDFNTLPEVSVMIMSLKAASLGLNMVAACHVLLLDLWWNPTTEDQAIDRAHRIGQTRPVTVLRMTVKDTVEDRILALQQRKREMVASAFGDDGTRSRETRLTVDDLKYLFGA
ncbi:hypothetical protein Ancab_005281 [Ancistrocladus abbreviatus]